MPSIIRRIRHWLEDRNPFEASSTRTARRRLRDANAEFGETNLKVRKELGLDWRRTWNLELESSSAYLPPRQSPWPPQFPSDSETNLKFALKAEIRLRDIALLLFGGLIVGVVLGIICVAVARSFTDSRFVTGITAATALYVSWLLGYEWLAKDRGWDSLRARFSSTRTKVLVVAAASGVALMLLTAGAANLLRWIGVDVIAPPLPDILPRNSSQLIFGIVLIAIIGPLTEELIFRGLLLDWLKQKINVWVAALILSAIFSLLHNNPFKLGAIGIVTFGARMALGLISSAFAIRYRSLRPSFAMHAVFNGIACTASALDGS